MARSAISLSGIGGLLGTFSSLRSGVSGADTWVIGSDVPYSVHQEYGTRYQSGTPHVRPAIDSLGGRVITLARRAGSFTEFLRLCAFFLERQIKRYAPVLTGRLRNSYEAEKE